jgi:predicted HicB family RNase H-like nuclease
MHDPRLAARHRVTCGTLFPHRTRDQLCRQEEADHRQEKGYKLVGMADPITFHGETVKELRAGYEAAVDHCIADCEATGRNPLKAASCKIMLRVSPDVHARALATAKISGKSLNQWAEEVLDKAAS